MNNNQDYIFVEDILMIESYIKEQIDDITNLDLNLDKTEIIAIVIVRLRKEYPQLLTSDKVLSALIDLTML